MISFDKGSLDQLGLAALNLDLELAERRSELGSYPVRGWFTTSGIGIRRVRIDLMLRERGFRAGQAP
jgi:hypothetical protein